MIELDLAAYLLSRTPITNLVGQRITEGRPPQSKQASKVESRITYRLQPGAQRHYHSRGASGLVEASIEITCVGSTYPKAREIYEALRNEIDGFSGLWETTQVDSCFLSPPERGTGDPSQGDDLGHPAVIAHAEIFYQEIIPANTA